MKKIIILLLISLLSFSCSKKENKLELVFEDNFKGSSLDEQKWNTVLKVFGRISDYYHNRSYLNYINPEDVILKDGLFLRTRDMGNGVYSSGLISSHEKFVFRYGYIEILAKYPKGNGLWPAFWLMPQDQTWPPEIDIAEFYGGKKLMHTGLCYGDFPNVQWDSDAYTNEEIENVYSTYGLWWTEKELVWLQNGEIKKEIKNKSYIPKIPMYIILSNGVSGKTGPAGIPDDIKNFPNFLEVKSVKVYRILEN